MAELIRSNRLYFEEGSLPIHLASDGQMYVRLDDLCLIIGLDMRDQERRIRKDQAIADRLVVFNIRGVEGDRDWTEAVPCLNAGSLSYWLGTIRAQHIKKADVRKRLSLFTTRFLDISWVVFKAGLVKRRRPENEPTPGQTRLL